MGPASPNSVLVGEISRRTWQKGGQFAVTLTIVPRRVIEVLRKAYVREMGKAPKPGKAAKP